MGLRSSSGLWEARAYGPGRIGRIERPVYVICQHKWDTYSRVIEARETGPSCVLIEVCLPNRFRTQCAVYGAAILLMVVRLGIRVPDIEELRLSNWNLAAGNIET